jgi:small subunit ribosomal protein S9
MEKQKNAIGRRKEAVTRVFISKGDGKITVNMTRIIKLIFL